MYGPKKSASTLEAVAFGATMFGSACINNLFVTYYMDLFCGVVSVSTTWFFVGQFIFMLWNALNDFVFGWFSDKLANQAKSTNLSARRNPLKSRARAIFWGGLVWSLAFLVIWFPPSKESPDFIKGLHFATSLCLYDGMLSYVEVSHSALLAEICTSNRGRATCNMYSAIFAICGSLSSFFGHLFWESDDLTAFRKVCFLASLLSFFSFSFTSCIIFKVATAETFPEGPALPNPYVSDQLTISTINGDAIERRRSVEMVSRCLQNECTKEIDKHPVKSASIGNFLRQVCRQRNFVIFVMVQCLQNFDCTFEKNFFHVFLRSFSAGVVSKSTQGIILSSSFIVPWIGTVLLTPAIQRYGVYNCVKNIFRLRILIAVLSVNIMFMSPIVACAALLVNRVTSESICRLCPLVISQLIDEDKFLHRETNNIRSASIVGASQILGKFSQSLAPMLGYAFLQLNTLEVQDEALSDSDVIKSNTEVSLIRIFLLHFSFIFVILTK